MPTPHCVEDQRGSKDLSKAMCFASWPLDLYLTCLYSLLLFSSPIWDLLLCILLYQKKLQRRLRILGKVR